MNIYPIEDIVKLQPKGLITIPKKLRTAIGLKGSDVLRLRAVNGQITLEPVHVLPYQVRSYSDKEVNEFLALDQVETTELKKKKLLP
jgi:AbrB family looped-hinge helix DNA binding protein